MILLGFNLYTLHLLFINIRVSLTLNNLGSYPYKGTLYITYNTSITLIKKALYSLRLFFCVSYFPVILLLLCNSYMYQFHNERQDYEFIKKMTF